MKLIKKLKKGFTLVELVVVIAIIAILAGVSVGVYVGITNSAKESAAKQEATDILTVVRAAVLVDADGFEFKDAIGKTVTAHWDVTNNGQIKFVKGAGDNTASTATDADLLCAVYKAVEGKEVPGKSLLEASLDSNFKPVLSDNKPVSEETNKANGFIKGFIYTSLNEVSVVVTF